MTPLAIRLAGPADASRLARFGAEQFREAYGRTHPEPTLGAYLRDAFDERRTARMLADPARAALIAELPGERWVGYAELREGAPSAPTTRLDVPLPGAGPVEIVRFYVARAWQGRGVAQVLMAACERHVRERGCDALWLQAWQQAPQALRFYEKAGFRVWGTAVFKFGARMDADWVLARAIDNPASPG